jgi:hypothetical protein
MRKIVTALVLAAAFTIGCSPTPSSEADEADRGSGSGSGSAQGVNQPRVSPQPRTAGSFQPVVVSNGRVTQMPIGDTLAINGAETVNEGTTLTSPSNATIPLTVDNANGTGGNGVCVSVADTGTYPHFPIPVLTDTAISVTNSAIGTTNNYGFYANVTGSENAWSFFGAAGNIYNAGSATLGGQLFLDAIGTFIQLTQISGAAASPVIEAYAGNPNTIVSGNVGDFLIDTSTPTLWQSAGGTTWTQVGTATGSGVSGQVAVWNGAKSLTGYTGLTSDSSGDLTTATLTNTAETNSGALVLSGKTTDTSTGTVNNFNIPTGAGGTAVLRSNPASAVTYTGFECGGSTCTSANDGQVLIIYNASSATAVVLADDSSSSTSGNRIYTTSGRALTIEGYTNTTFYGVGHGAMLIYDGAATHWTVFAANTGVLYDLTIGGSQLVFSAAGVRLRDIVATASAITLSSCGTSPTSTNGAGLFSVTTGLLATGCTVTFTSAFQNTPTCVVTSENATPVVYSATTSVLTLSTGVAASTRYDIHCVDH